MEVRLFLIFGFMLATLVTKTFSECSTEGFRTDWVGSTNASLAWTLGEGCGLDKIVRFEVQWEHIKYKACTDGRRDHTSHGSLEVHTTKAQLSNLHPFSMYEVTLKTTTKDKTKMDPLTLQLETQTTVPATQPLVDPDLKPNSPLQQAIWFYWVPQSQDECHRQNGRSDGYEVSLEGLDRWDMGQKKLTVGNTTKTPSFYAENLKPFTNYLLRVYNRNLNNLVNYQMPLEIRERTLPTVPDPPVNLTAKVNSARSVHLSWSPSYPPKGDTVQYTLQYGKMLDDPDPFWLPPVNVTKDHQGICPGDRRRRTDEWLPRSFCYVVNLLDPDTGYMLRMKAWNKDIDSPSEWSQEILFRTEKKEGGKDDIDYVTTSFPVITQSPPDDEGLLSHSTVILLLCLGAGILLMVVVITAMIYKLKIVRLKQQIRHEETWNQTTSRSSSYLPGAGPGSTSTQMTETYLVSLARNSHQDSVSIQQRRLPEPPPLKTTEPSYSEAYEMNRVDSPAGPGYLDMSPSHRSSTSPLESTRIQEEEVTDVEGYLRPTFPNTNFTPIRVLRERKASQSDSDYVSESHDQAPVSLISPESYVAPEQLFQQGQVRRSQRSQGSSSSSELKSSPCEPLISISRAIDV